MADQGSKPDTTPKPKSAGHKPSNSMSSARRTSSTQSSDKPSASGGAAQGNQRKPQVSGSAKGPPARGGATGSNSPGGRSGGQTGGGHRSTASMGSNRIQQTKGGNGSFAGGDGNGSSLNNLQNLIQDIKKGPSPGSELSALERRLSEQEQSLQAQIQHQLALGQQQRGLPSLGEDVEAGPDGSPQDLNQSPLNRQGGPRFAGNAAFQSALARHNQPGAGGPGRASAASHARQLSLQGRFADLGYSSSGPGGLLGSVPHELDDADGATDDGASSVDMMGGATFDPTRRSHVPGHDAAANLQAQMQMQLMQRGVAAEFPMPQPHPAVNLQHRSNSQQQQQQQQNFNASGMQNYYSNHDLINEQMSIQQQIEMLQLQQQQLQAQQYNASIQSMNMPSPQTQNVTGHRRIQSHASSTGQMGSFSLQGSLGQMQQSPRQQVGGPNVPRGHGRRHSVNVVNKAAGAQSPPSGDATASGAPQMDSNPAFSFPPGRPAQTSPQQHHHQHQQSMSHQAPPMGVGHFSHPSVQLSTLSPEYLMAAGGLVSIPSLQMSNSLHDLADGFNTSSGGGRGGHNRAGSQNWRGSGGGQQMDLASAQAQLMSLNQLRASSGAGGGGGGHHKGQSFGGGFGGQQFGNFQPPQGGQGLQRKPLFGSYLPQASLPPLLAAGKLVVGMLRVNKRNRSDAYVSTEILDSDVFISGSKDRNRALEGDLVAVELLDPNEVWSIKKEKEDKKKRKEEQAAAAAGSGSPSAPGRKNEINKVKDDLEVEGAQLKLIEDEEENEASPPALAGHVVAIVERTPGQLFSGTLGLLRPSSVATKEKQQAERAAREGGDGTQHHEVQTRPKIVWFRPTDKRVPLIAIPADQAPRDFWEEGSQEGYNSRLFVACIKRWPITSLHPFGTLVEEIGVIGNVEAETQALLKDSLSSATEDFGEAALKCLPPTPWSIPEIETEQRRDFRSARVFTIDPEGAKDLDDAVSVSRLEGGLIEVGVHIADVSYFVKLNNALDRDARKRGTSVYLVQRAVPMLPPILSEELCSLVPHVDRLTFSAVFTMNKEGRVIGTWHGRTIIRSCAKLAYEDAQAVIDGQHVRERKVESHPVSEVEEDILTLHQLAQKLRARRFENGALKIDNIKLSFKLDDNGLPTDANPYETGEAHQLIEELMLQANISVAQRIASGLPDVALLRRHDQPIDRRVESFEARARKLGFSDMDCSSGAALYASLQRIKDPKDREALQTLVTKAMVRAKYFCTGMVDIAKYAHYALNVPLYTHFTSPIRRYADLMVHRQLEAVLSGMDKFPVDREAMAKVAQQCNVKRDAAKIAQEQSQHLFLCLLIHDLTVRYGPVIRPATVISVLDAAFDVVIPEFGVEKRVHVDQMPIEHHSHDEKTNVLSVYWKPDVDVLTWLADNSDDVHVKRLREMAQQHSMMEMTSQSHTDEAALFDDDEDEDDELAAARKAMLSGEDAKDSKQRTKSFKKGQLQFEGLETTASGHRIQHVKELASVPVIVTSDMSKSPPVLKVFSVNPWATSSDRHE